MVTYLGGYMSCEDNFRHNEEELWKMQLSSQTVARCSNCNILSLVWRTRELGRYACNVCAGLVSPSSPGSMGCGPTDWKPGLPSIGK